MVVEVSPHGFTLALHQLIGGSGRQSWIGLEYPMEELKKELHLLSCGVLERHIFI